MNFAKRQQEKDRTRSETVFFLLAPEQSKPVRQSKKIVGENPEGDGGKKGGEQRQEAVARDQGKTERGQRRACAIGVIDNEFSLPKLSLKIGRKKLYRAGQQFSGQGALVDFGTGYPMRAVENLAEMAMQCFGESG